MKKMILPNKYITMSESLIGLSACVLDIIDDNRYTIEQVWDRLNKKYIRTNKIHDKPTYSKYILTITYMYISRMISYDEKGVIFNENIATKNN